MSKCITTFTHLHIDPLAPEAELIRIEDIAHSLSLLCRANGHYPRFYTVAQHCLDCCAEAKARNLSKRLQLGCLLHDAGEAYFSDIPKPVKDRFPEFAVCEQRILDVIYKKYLGSELSGREAEIIAGIDSDLFYNEFNCVMGECHTDVLPKLKSKPDFKTRPAIEMEEAYKTAFRRLCKTDG